MFKKIINNSLFIQVKKPNTTFSQFSVWFIKFSLILRYFIIGASPSKSFSLDLTEEILGFCVITTLLSCLSIILFANLPIYAIDYL